MHKSAVYGLCLRLMGASMSAEDMAQETWMRVIRSAAQFQTTGSVKSWILTIAKNLCLNEIRQRRWEVSNDDKMDAAQSDDDLEENLSRLQQLDLLKQAVDKLPDRQRQALVLFMFEEKTMSELATELGLQVNAVKALLFRARENVQKLIRGGA
jgi:RNA polymerase sigma-70 factor (ECF subfamily)